MDEDQAYRAMDLLIEADAQAQVQEGESITVADLLNLGSTCCSSTPRAPASDAAPKTPGQPRTALAGGLRRYGHSKDSRPDLPQIVIGLAVTREGIPVRLLGRAG